MAHARLDTATQRPATGLDFGARQLVLQVVGEVAGLGPAEVVGIFFRDRFGGRADYIEALKRVWGDSVGFRVNQAMSEAAVETEFPAEAVDGAPKTSATFLTVEQVAERQDLSPWTSTARRSSSAPSSTVAAAGGASRRGRRALRARPSRRGSEASEGRPRA
jgi:hypothetical protein